MCSLFCISLIQDHCELCHFFLWQAWEVIQDHLQLVENSDEFPPLGCWAGHGNKCGVQHDDDDDDYVVSIEVVD